MSLSETLKYRAFLSYAHADTRWAKWLHGQLEGFRIDKDLKGRATPMGPVPRTLRPIFRDREDFSGGHSLNDATIAALDQSAAHEAFQQGVIVGDFERAEVIDAEIDRPAGVELAAEAALEAGNGRGTERHSAPIRKVVREIRMSVVPENAVR